MRKFIQDTQPVVRKIVSTFQTRLLKILIKMAVLCSVAEALSIKDKSKRFTVTSKNVEAAGVIVQQCYKTLVAWLERSLKVSALGGKLNHQRNNCSWKAAKESKKDEEWFLCKNDLMKKLEESGVTYSTRYRMFGDYENDKYVHQKKNRSNRLLEIKGGKEMKYENTYVVFDVTKGPKVIIETLDTYGDEGWECCSMLSIAGTNIVAFLKRRIGADEPTVDEESEKISKLWSSD